MRFPAELLGHPPDEHIGKDLSVYMSHVQRKARVHVRVVCAVGHVEAHLLSWLLLGKLTSLSGIDRRGTAFTLLTYWVGLLLVCKFVSSHT